MTTLGERLGSLFGDELKRLLLLVLACVGTALVIVDYARVPNEDILVGDVATRTVAAPFTFRYQDFAERERRQDEASAAVPWVFVHRADLGDQLARQVSRAYAAGRTELGASEGEQASGEDVARIAKRFRDELGVYVPDVVVHGLIRAGFPDAAEALSTELLRAAMAGPVLADPTQLPAQDHPLTLISIRGTEREERTLTTQAIISTPAQARDRVSLQEIEGSADPAWAEAAVAVARASVRANLDFDALNTEERRSRAAAEVPMVPIVVKRGTTLFRQGDVLTELDVVRYKALQSSRRDSGTGMRVLSVSLFLLVVLAPLYQFGSSYLPDFSTRVRDVAAASLLLVFMAVNAKVIVIASPSVAELIGGQIEPGAVWFAVPVAGAAMLVRLLIGVSWSLVFSVASAVICGLVMDLEALYVGYFLVSAIAAAGSVEHTRERMVVLRAGVFAGMLNAALVLVIYFLELFLTDGAVTASPALLPLWAMGFAFIGAIGSAFMVLALTPLFEVWGFVTDYRLLELANLNHPLLRQLMLRAPGSYHHSVIVGSLSEAACEAIGANALQARVAAYFHDIGKSVKPQYFVENQRGGVNRHDALDASASARVIINHVVDGGRMAQEYNLPKPILDNIYMHHGTGLLQYFFAKAKQERAENGGPRVEESDFRYPGPKPNTREAGVIMLADKVEAATRTIKTPNEENVRAMIEQIINSVMADGQFEKCPLTFQELYTIADTFVSVLMGIYHHRIEYPSTAAISSGIPGQPPRPHSIITLEIPSPGRAPEEDDLPIEVTDDYEAVENLPHGS